jgi:transketolase
MVVLDAETSNSTYAEAFMKAHPDRSFEMFIAEQNMVGVALGLALRGKMPFISTFAAFLSRAFDQLRTAQYSGAHINVAGSHAGVSIGEDGATQMGLEDIAMFRTFLNSTVLYPADHVSAEKLTSEMAHTKGITYIRTTRGNTETLYDAQDTFPIGGSKVLRHSKNDAVTIVAAGITEKRNRPEDTMPNIPVERAMSHTSVKAYTPA